MQTCKKVSLVLIPMRQNTYALLIACSAHTLSLDCSVRSSKLVYRTPLVQHKLQASRLHTMTEQLSQRSQSLKSTQNTNGTILYGTDLVYWAQYLPYFDWQRMSSLKALSVNRRVKKTT